MVDTLLFGNIGGLEELWANLTEEEKSLVQGPCPCCASCYSADTATVTGLSLIESFDRVNACHWSSPSKLLNCQYSKTASTIGCHPVMPTETAGIGCDASGWTGYALWAGDSTNPPAYNIESRCWPFSPFSSQAYTVQICAGGETPEVYCAEQATEAELNCLLLCEQDCEDDAEAQYSLEELALANAWDAGYTACSDGDTCTDSLDLALAEAISSCGGNADCNSNASTAYATAVALCGEPGYDCFSVVDEFYNEWYTLTDDAYIAAVAACPGDCALECSAVYDLVYDQCIDEGWLNCYSDTSTALDALWAAGGTCSDQTFTDYLNTYECEYIEISGVLGTTAAGRDFHGVVKHTYKFNELCSNFFSANVALVSCASGSLEAAGGAYIPLILASGHGSGGGTYDGPNGTTYQCIGTHIVQGSYTYPDDVQFFFDCNSWFHDCDLPGSWTCSPVIFEQDCAHCSDWIEI